MFFARGSVRIEGLFFFFQAEDGIRDTSVTGVQTCALPISAVRALFGACNAQSASEATLDVLVGLVTPETLPAYLDALRSPSDGITDAATRALSRAATYNPAQLLTLYSDERFSRARVEGILEAQLPRLKPDTLLRLLPELGKEARVSAFRLVEKLADERLLETAVELSQSPDWWIRLHVTKLLARF